VPITLFDLLMVMFVTILVIVVWFYVLLADERVDLVLRPELPNSFPSDFLRHSYAIDVLVFLLESEKEQKPARLTGLRRRIIRPRPVRIEQTHVSKIADMIGISRATALDTVEYLQKIEFVRTGMLRQKRYVSLTDKGRNAAAWSARNLSPSILDYLRSKYGKSWFTRLLGIRGPIRHQRIEEERPESADRQS